MGMFVENIAVMLAILKTVSEVIVMTTEEMKNDARYVLAMDMAKNLLETGAISNEEYQHFETKMIEKYRPLLGVLFSDTSC